MSGLFQAVGGNSPATLPFHFALLHCSSNLNFLDILLKLSFDLFNFNFQFVVFPVSVVFKRKQTPLIIEIVVTYSHFLRNKFRLVVLNTAAFLSHYGLLPGH